MSDPGNNHIYILRMWIEACAEQLNQVRITAQVDWQGATPPTCDVSDTVRVYPGDCCSESIYGVTPGYGEECELENPVAESRCWYDNGTNMGDVVRDDGFPLNLHVADGFGPPDLPPRKLAPELSSSPLVSKASMHSRLNPHAERALHADCVDIATGMPLIQEIDFELPFGGAVFRHVRTYSENFVDHLISREAGYGLQDWEWQEQKGGPEGTFWDWNGRFWMMGENPILLFDAAYRDVADWNSGANPPYGVRMCYFIPDAHHAIPFIDHDGNGNYTAPSWFDATMTCEGGVKENGTWTDPPEYVVVTTQRGSVTYEFEIHYEDTWQANYRAEYEPGMQGYRPSHAHPKDPSNPGFGFPHYGIVQRIWDTYGNTIEYEYEPFRQRDCLDDYEAAGEWPNPPCCNNCCQNCNEKGQIRAVRLRAADGLVKWTLLYTHRSFGGGAACGAPSPVDVMHHHALHSIHVYEGLVTAQQPLTIGYATHFAGLTSFDGYDDVDAETLGLVPGGWVLRARYTYNEINDLNPGGIYAEAPQNSQYRKYADILGSPQDGDCNGYQLLKVSVTRRSPGTGGGSEETSEHTLYRYAHVGSGHLSEVTSGYRYLRSIWSSKTCDAVLEFLKKSEPSTTVNDLICRPDGEPGRANDPSTFQNEAATFAGVADLTFERRLGQGDRPQADYVNEFADFVSVAKDRLVWEKRGLECMVDRRGADLEPKRYMFYRLQNYAEVNWTQSPVAVNGSYGNFHGDHALYHWPYRFRVSDPGHPWDPTGPREMGNLDASKPFHIMVIDECDSEKTYNFEDPCTFKSRRVVELSPIGVVLSDKTWEFPKEYGAGGPVLVQRLGMAEQRFYDTAGRLILLASKGWASEENTDPENLGLVHVFKYFDEASGAKGELQAVGIRSGIGPCNQYGQPSAPYENVYWTRAYQRVPGHPELVADESTYPIPSLNFSFSEPTVTHYEYEFDTTNPKKIIGKTVTRPAAPRTAGGPDCHPIEKYIYDNNGNLTWAGVGSDDGGSGFTEFYITYTQYDGYGRPTLNVIDAEAGSGGVPGFPANWERAGPTAELELRTEWTYDPIFGPTKVVYPNGREKHIVYKNDPPGSAKLEVWDYTLAPGGSGWECVEPIKITRVEGGKVLWVKQVGLPTPADYPPKGTENYQGHIISEWTPSYGMTGQMTGMRQTAGTSTLSSSVSYHAGGLIAREVTPDGTITRYTYDLLGRLWRTFRGTKDEHVVWGTAGSQPSSWNDDLVLTEKRYYGEGLHDADELVEVREYRDRPDNQYMMWDPELLVPGSNPPVYGWWAGGVVPNEDDIGWATTYEYDRRMRPVWSTRWSEGPVTPSTPALQHTLTWYDNLGRPVLVAEYGPVAGVPAALDPRLLGIGWPGAGLATIEQAAVDLVSVTPNGPISLTQNVYNARGLVEETRQWRLIDNEPVYTASLTYYNHVGRPLEVHAPNSPVQQYVYDAKGRQVAAYTVAAGVVVSQTDTAYDKNDRAIKTTFTEYDESGQNGISTYTLSWYDDAGRVIATANYGTNNTTFSAGGDDPTWTPTPPTSPYPEGVLVTEYEYDDAGRQVAVHHPDGTVTRSEYDGFGRLLMTTENADGPNDLTRYTAYKYDDVGRLEKMAAVLPTNFSGAPTWANIAWGATDGSIQVTTFEYDAVIYPGTWVMPGYSGGWNPGWAGESASKSWISRVTYPAREPNDPNTADWLEFAYYSDGSVAMRTDSRGNEFYHEYDELGRRIKTWIDDVAYYSYAPLPSWVPTNRVQYVKYEYDAEGRLATVTAQTSTAQTIATNTFDYDDAGNLLTETQQHAGQSPRTVTYEWDFAGHGAGNYNRPVGLTYPAGGTELTFGYDTPVSSALSRVTSLSDGGPLALYGYFGSGRRVNTVLGTSVIQSFGSGANYPGLDQFGRVIDLKFDAVGSWQTLHRYQYGYDAAGNRLYAHVQQVGHDNDRSYAYGYDALSRLRAADLGVLSSSPPWQIVATPGVASRSHTWTPDVLGNWVGDANDPNYPFGLQVYIDADGNGQSEAWITTVHDVNPANQITQITKDDSQVGDWVRQPVYDRAGNLVWDGRYFFQYDGFSRLVQVYYAPSLQPDSFDADGRLGSAYGNLLGAKVAAFTYDGLGRLIRTQRWRSGGATQVAEYYYDGVRRIQEVETTTGGASPGTVTREYVWGPGYADEIVCQLDYSADPLGGTGVTPETYYYLQDANYNVVAVVAPASGPNPPAVLWQYTYGPYGVSVL